MIVNLNKSTSRYHSKEHHVRFGIQNWLNKMKFIVGESGKINQELYKELILDFCKSEFPDFKPKHGIKSCESFIDKRFQKFMAFCISKFK